MRHIKIPGLVTIAACIAMGLAGASSAIAESTLLCTQDTKDVPNLAECQEPSTVHFVTVGPTVLDAGGVELSSPGKATLLNEVLNVPCEILIAGTVLQGLVANGPASVHFTAAQVALKNCTFTCTDKTLKGGTLLILKTGPESFSVTLHGYEVLINCFGFFSCIYDGTGLVGDGVGPLVGHTAGRGHITYQDDPIHLASNESGGCPAVTKYDVLFQSLTPLYVRS